ncbi:MAG: hypothetical protein H6822_28145 [Planctomycetaceae bacterium]|nr:hypothetical protein [Planctomycetales bacterium]MCB9926053.1 hypothetical protein [Planctomycetaceae bacterium]
MRSKTKTIICLTLTLLLLGCSQGDVAKESDHSTESIVGAIAPNHDLGQHGLLPRLPHEPGIDQQLDVPPGFQPPAIDKAGAAAFSFGEEGVQVVDDIHHMNIFPLGDPGIDEPLIPEIPELPQEVDVLPEQTWIPGLDADSHSEQPKLLSPALPNGQVPNLRLRGPDLNRAAELPNTPSGSRGSQPATLEQS